MIGLPVGAAVHGDEVGDGAAPDVFAGFRLPVGDGKIAGPGGGVVIVQHLRLHRVHQRRQPGVILFVGRAPVAAQDCVGQVALPPGRVRRQPPGSGVGCVIPAVERVAVGGNGLCLERFVRPRDRHLRRHCPDQILPPGHRRHGSVAQVPDEKALAVLIGGRRGSFRQGSRVGCRRFRGALCSLRGRPAQRGSGQPVPGQRQQTARCEQHGTEQKKGAFHHRTPPGQAVSFRPV